MKLENILKGNFGCCMTSQMNTDYQFCTWDFKPNISSLPLGYNVCFSCLATLCSSAHRPVAADTSSKAVLLHWGKNCRFLHLLHTQQTTITSCTFFLKSGAAFQLGLLELSHIDGFWRPYVSRNISFCQARFGVVTNILLDDSETVHAIAIHLVRWL